MLEASIWALCGNILKRGLKTFRRLNYKVGVSEFGKSDVTGIFSKSQCVIFGKKFVSSYPRMRD